MALSCEVVGGQPQVEKAEKQTYAIVGKREQQTLRVCSGPSGASCRDLEIHKFAFDCAGKPVNWVDAAAAGVRGQPWRATLIDARMTLHYWPDGPSVDRRLPLTLPSGFAPPPAGGLDFSSPAPMHVEQTSPLEAPAPSLGEIAEPSQANAGAPKVTSLRFERPPAHETHDAEPVGPRPAHLVALRDRPVLSDAAEVATPRMAPVDLGWTATAIIDSAGRRDSWWRHLVPSVLPDELLTAIGIAALLLSATAVAARQHGAHRVSGSRAATIEPAHADLQMELPDHSTRVEVPPPTHPRPARSVAADDGDDPVAELASALLDPGPPAQPAADWSSLVEMRATADALLELVRQIVADHVPEGAVRDVLVADLSVIAARLQGQELADALAAGRKDLAEAIYSQAILDLERARTLSRIEHERALQIVDEQIRSPATVDEAYAFLGVNPRAGAPVVKKVVDALRQNWHPDLAGDETDRRAREERMKQINAAWDLIRLR
ncbi:MAG: hypothetical protein AB7L90_05295 [Hyphomicrobiaceae bacterium]